MNLGLLTSRTVHFPSYQLYDAFMSEKPTIFTQVSTAAVQKRENQTVR